MLGRGSPATAGPSLAAPARLRHLSRRIRLNRTYHFPEPSRYGGPRGACVSVRMMRSITPCQLAP